MLQSFFWKMSLIFITRQTIENKLVWVKYETKMVNFMRINHGNVVKLWIHALQMSTEKIIPKNEKRFSIREITTNYFRPWIPTQTSGLVPQRFSVLKNESSCHPRWWVMDSKWPLYANLMFSACVQFLLQFSDDPDLR